MSFVYETSRRDTAEQLIASRRHMADKPTLATESGARVADNQHSQTAGPGGPTLLQDHHLIETLARFNRERIPERVVHAVGTGAYGALEVTNAEIPRWTKMEIFEKPGNKTGMFMRVSTVAASRDDIIERSLADFRKADAEFGWRVSERIAKVRGVAVGAQP